MNVTYGSALVLRRLQERLTLERAERSEERKSESELEDKENGFLFVNHLGVDLKIARHSEFNDENLISIGQLEENPFGGARVATSVTFEHKVFSLKAGQELYVSYDELAPDEKR